MRALLIVLAACGSAPERPPSAPAASEPLASLAWWRGDWRGEHGDEHWVAAGGALYGIGLQDGGFEVMIVDDGGSDRGAPDGIVRFLGMPGGAPPVEFRKREAGASSITFANDQHDFPKAITYARTGDELHATAGDDTRADRFRFTRWTAPRAPELEAADTAFARDTAARGLEGWVAAFAADGAMLSRGRRVEGPAAIRELMAPLLAKYRVAWAPIASARRGALGYTVGTATFTGADDGWRSSYVTIWKQTAGGWKVLFDTGRPVHE